MVGIDTAEMSMARFRPQEIVIPDTPGSDPFEHCKLGRKAAADMLTGLIKSSETGLVIGLNAAWGDEQRIKRWISQRQRRDSSQSRSGFRPRATGIQRQRRDSSQPGASPQVRIAKSLGRAEGPINCPCHSLYLSC